MRRPKPMLPATGTAWACSTHGRCDPIFLGGEDVSAYCPEEGCAEKAVLVSRAPRPSDAYKSWNDVVFDPNAPKGFDR